MSGSIQKNNGIRIRQEVNNHRILTTDLLRYTDGEVMSVMDRVSVETLLPYTSTGSE